MQDQIASKYLNIDRTITSSRQASARSDARLKHFPPIRNERSAASNSFNRIRKGHSNSVELRHQATRAPKIWMLFSLLIHALPCALLGGARPGGQNFGTTNPPLNDIVAQA